MQIWLIAGLMVVALALASTGMFFFVATRGALLMRALGSAPVNGTSHVYPIYSDRRLIKLVDFQPLMSALLLFQYRRLVSAIVAGLMSAQLKDRQVLITSCAFGNVIPRLVDAAFQAGADRVVIADIIRNELDHARSKLGKQARKVEFVEDDATALKRGDGTAAANVMFFLLHELPHPMKAQALREAGRVLAPGGKLFLAEFHKPHLRALRALSWTYFKVFEPLGLALWDTHDPVRCLEEMGGWKCERTTCFFGNFQMITATRL